MIGSKTLIINLIILTDVTALNDDIFCMYDMSSRQ